MEVVVGLYDPVCKELELVSMDYKRKVMICYQNAEKELEIEVAGEWIKVLGVKLRNGKILIDPIPPSLLKIKTKN